MCRDAAIKPLREYIRANPADLQRTNETSEAGPDVPLRPLVMEDFEVHTTHARTLGQAYNLDDRLFALSEGLD
ncbi:hypothetical protein IWW35_005055 [Coemansia sp. RSA 1878]|nr:hypothetical protein IWW35_005055 [Coemansia sp. RSA 1878]